MKDWLRKFMLGRYGNDGLNKALLVAGIVCIILSWITRWAALCWITLLCLLLCYYRMLSRNIARRQQENVKYYQATAKLRKEWEFQKRKWRERKSYHYFKCPYCHARLRLPVGKGRVIVRCNKCGREFEKTSK